MKEKRIMHVLGSVNDKYIEEMYLLYENTSTSVTCDANRKDSLHGMNYVEDASTATPEHTRKRIVFAILIAAIICLFTVVAVATTISISTDEWFTSFFGHGTQEAAESELTANQSEILHAGLVDINQSMTNQGYTVTLESGLCDGYRALIKCRIDAPEGVILNAQNYGLDYGNDIAHASGLPWNYSAASWSSCLLEDDDPNDNSIISLLDIDIQPPEDSDISMADGTIWTITIYSITERTGQDEGAFWNTLCEGSWEFQIAFKDELIVTKSVELLDKPVRCNSTMFINNWLIRSMRLPMKTTVRSFELRPLSATIRYNRPLIASFEGVDLDAPIYLVMKDGSRVEVKLQGVIYRGDYDEVFCTFDRPVAVEEVEYIELPGTGSVPVSSNGNQENSN